MMTGTIRVLAVVLPAIFGLTACSDETATTAEPSLAGAEPSLAQMVVHKSPSCGCCTEWVEHMRQAGFTVVVRETTNPAPIQQRVGLPSGMGSCHTAEVEGYFVEGHVPAADVARLLDERPDARGLTVPGMPLGSPGMEVPSGEVHAYDVLLVRPDGSTRVFASHGA
jgi:hypothetical protein